MQFQVTFLGGRHFRCEVCGKVQTAENDDIGAARCQVCPSFAIIHRRGIGDSVAAGLSAIGITRERINHWLLVARHWPEVPAVYLNYKIDCGCAHRQAALNRFGWRLQDALNRWGWWLRRLR